MMRALLITAGSILVLTSTALPGHAAPDKSPYLMHDFSTDRLKQGKFDLLGNNGGNYALAVVPYIKTSVADRYMDDKRWEGGSYVPLNIALPHEWTMNFVAGIDVLRNTAFDNINTSYQNLVGFSHPITNDVSGAVELWSNVDTRRDATAQYSLDFSATWSLNSNLQFDIGTNIGLNRAADNMQVFAGISKRF